MRNKLCGRRVGVWGMPNGVFGVVVALAMLVAGGAAEAEIYIVDQLNALDSANNDRGEYIDAVPGDGIAEITIGGGETSLRSAIEESNQLPGRDTIRVPGGSTLMLRRQLPPLTDPDGVIIETVGEGNFVVDGSTAVARIQAYISLITSKFEDLDGDDDELLSYGEVQGLTFDDVKDIIHHLYDLPREDFDNIDADNDELISMQELEDFTPLESGLIFESPGNELRNVTFINFPINGLRFNSDDADNNIVQGCMIGTTGSGDNGNKKHGILLANGAQNNVIGGATEEARNIISGNGTPDTDEDGNTIDFGNGIYIVGANTTGNRIIGNYIGVNADGSAAVPNSFSGVVIEAGANGNYIGGANEGEGNIIAGNGDSSDGCDDNCGNGSAFYFGHGVVVSGATTTDNFIQGNWIGIGADNESIRNQGAGVRFSGTVGNTIGGDTESAGNRIAHHGNVNFVSSGIRLGGADGARVENNVVFGNNTSLVVDGGSNCIIGSPGAGNVLSGNVDGASFGSGFGHIFQGNYVGVQRDGVTRQPNGDSGMFVSGFVRNMLIGGSGAGEGNIFSGNNEDGLVIYGLTSDGDPANPAVTVQGNRIGTDASGTIAVPNTVVGILLNAGARDILIGGTGAGEGNVISGNGLDGIRIARRTSGTGTNEIVIHGNYIGTDINGENFIPNQNSGVGVFEGGNTNMIGGTGDGEGNVIAGNTIYGVRIKGGSLETTNANTVRGNSIFSNGMEGIRLEDDGNDAIAAPTLNTIGPVAGTGPANATIDLYGDTADEGRLYIGEGMSDGAGNFSFNIDLSALTAANLDKLTATATDATGNTSEFSEPFAIAPPEIAVQPADLLIVEGEAFDLATVVTGSEPLAYQWAFSADGGAFVDLTLDGVFTGVTSATLQNSGVRLSDAGRYQCTISNALGTVMTSIVTVEVIAANLDMIAVNTLNDTSDGDTQSVAHLFVNPGADGLISLREAIAAANARAGADTISFEGTLSGSITPDDELTEIADMTGGLTINGGGAITLDGQNLGGSDFGLRITSADNVITGLAFIKFPGNALEISGASATGNTVTDCVIGNNGTEQSGNLSHGVVVHNGASDNVIGGPMETDRNFISGNGRDGIHISGTNTTGNRVIGNFIGTSMDGASALANGENGVTVTAGASNNSVGGTDAGEGNVITSNTDSGVQIAGAGGATDGNLILGNVIGLGANGEEGLGNIENGVVIASGATNTVVGGDDVAGANTISGNGDAGVLVDGPATAGNTIRLNRIYSNFAAGIILAAGSNADIAAPELAGIAPVSGTAEANSTVDIYASFDNEGETHLSTVMADGAGAFSVTVDLEAVVGMNITATATDADGNTSEFSGPLFVDLEPPVITLLGDNPAGVQCGAIYTDAGVTATDDVDGDLSAQVTETIMFGGEIVPSVDTSTLGTYTITYEVSDNAGREATPVTRTVVVSDTTVPVITLLGDAAITIQCSASFTDPGATATDLCDGDTNVTVAGTVDTGTPGSYPLVYSAVDSQGNAAIQVTRTVTVVDSMAPSITLLGSAVVTLECGQPYLDPGATALDACEGDLTDSIEVDNPVDPGVAGTYIVLYDVSDSSGNIALQRFRTVEVIDTTPPVIVRLGAADITVECGVPFVDPGVTVTDACEGDLPAIVSGVVNTAIPGNYTLAYSASDSAGNVATTVTRTVRVADNAVPVITLLGSATVNVPCEGTYEEAGATATDACEGDLTEEIVISGTVDTDTPGQYTITYDVVDSVGNAAARVSRTVVVATCPAPCEDQCAADPDNQVDEDGDGLSACVEACLGSSDSMIDSDMDGVPDNFEVETGTDPVVPDSELDLDGDGLTQLEEFIFDSDPLNPNDPAESFFVSPAGANATNGGGASNPWGTIEYALSQANATANNPVRIVLADGNYPEDVVLQPWVTLVGAVGSLPRIEGTVFGANNSALINVEIAAFTSDDVMLLLDNVAMSVENVVFRGSVARPAAGILATGAATAATMIDGCLFTSLSIGIDVEGGLPVIRRCAFEDTTISAIFLRASANIGAGASLGDVDNPATGSNLFSGVVQGRAVINEAGTLLLAQQNDWGTTDVGMIESELISGPVEVAPVLTPGSAADTGSLYVTVWTATNQSRISTASVTVRSTSGATVNVPEERNGVYALPVLRAGDYRISVSAAGYTSQELSVNLAAGELGSHIVALSLVSAEKPGGPSCHGGSGSTAGINWTDLLLVLMLVGGLVVASRRRQPGEA